jgi:hypothetical protein
VDRAKKAAQQPQTPDPRPQTPAPKSAAPGDADLRTRLHRALTELNMPFTADAVEHSSVVEAGGELQFVTTAADRLALRPDDIQKALQHLGMRALRVKVTVGDPGVSAAPIAAPAPAKDEDEATNRALANPEVQRFREVFGGEIRKVRNLKE